MLLRSSRWVDADEKKRDIVTILFDDDVAIDACRTARARRLKEGVSLFDFAIIKKSLRFYVAINRGRIDDERIIVDSVITFAKWYFAEFARLPTT